MVHLVNGPARFADDALHGVAAAHPDLVRAVDGGVVRARPGPPGKTALVVGGGSGHYPAFAGLVGRGLADGAVAGHVFTSPSARRVRSVAEAADRGGGVLLACGNYAGDRLNFGLAVEQLRARGLDARLLLVADDIASATDQQWEQRRGVAGGLVVFKLAGAAAEAGATLDDVERVAIAANAATRTLGVAFAGCTLPGDREPLFRVAPTRMAVGLGIHGEPGIAEDDLPSAQGLARLLVERVVPADVDAQGRAAAVVLNGLGSTSSEELFVLWVDVLRELGDRGVRVIAPEVGSLVTSLDMAGCSLTVTWLDEELEPLWLAACHSPALTRFGADTPLTARAGTDLAHGTTLTRQASADNPMTVRARSTGDPRVAQLVSIATRVTEGLATHETRLGRLDSVAGDGDHGTAMTRGAAAALARIRTASSPQQALLAAGEAWGDEAGGTSGVLWSAAITAFARTAFDREAPQAVQAAVDAVAALGGAVVGDKTMLDAMVPFAEALSDGLASGAAMVGAVDAAVRAAEDGARATAGMSPRVGRARPLAAQSLGHEDPGAASFVVVARAVADAMADH